MSAGCFSFRLSDVSTRWSVVLFSPEGKEEKKKTTKMEMVGSFAGLSTKRNANLTFKMSEIQQIRTSRKSIHEDKGRVVPATSPR